MLWVDLFRHVLSVLSIDLVYKVSKLMEGIETFGFRCFAQYNLSKIVKRQAKDKVKSRIALVKIKENIFSNL